PVQNKKWTTPIVPLDLEASVRFYSRALEQFQGGNFWQVERLCVSAIKNNPADARFHHLLALALTHHSHSAKAAEESFRQAIQLQPQNSQYRLDLATFLFNCGSLDSALQECSLMIEMWPS